MSGGKGQFCRIQQMKGEIFDKYSAMLTKRPFCDNLAEVENRLFCVQFWAFFIYPFSIAVWRVTVPPRQYI